MSLNTSINLIDLCAEDVNICKENPSSSSKLKTEENTTEIVLNNNQDNANNPFDKLLGEADVPNDPFEMLLKEAESYKMPCPNIVVTENLLQLEELENETDNANTQDDAFTEEYIKVPSISRGFSSSSNQLSSISSLNSQPSPNCDSVFNSFNSPILSSTSRGESILTINKGFITENTISTTSIDVSSSNTLNKGFINSPDLSDTGLDSISNKEATSSSAPDTPDTNSPESGSKNKKKMKLESRNLLRISLSNAVNSPQRRQSKQSEDSFERSVLAEAGNLAEELSKMALYSPKISEDSCDDLMSIKPHWVDSETDVDSDLELLKIPMLQEIEQSKEHKTKNVEDAISFELQEQENMLQTDNKSTSPDLESLKEKIRLSKAKEHDTDISNIIDGLKKIILDCSNQEKKAEANGLLESLSSLFKTENNYEKSSPPIPQPIIRQGTFDLDIPKKRSEESPNKNESHKEKNLKTPEQDTQDAPDFLQQIGKMFGNDNVNIIQANLSTAATVGNNPTYIVVMGTPNTSKNFGIQANDGSPDLINQARRRSNSLSLHDKKSRMSMQVANNEKSRHDFITPSRTVGNRRNSISYSPYQSNVSSVRRSIYSSSGIGSSGIASKPPVEKFSNRDKGNDIKQKVVVNNKPDLNVKNLRVKSTEQVRKSQGPMKATIPIKKVAPMIITSSVSSPIEDSKKMKVITSTPLPTSKGFPAACSTPAIKVKMPSPGRNANKSKTRYSYLSTTPNPKARLSVTSSNHVRRRSLTDLNSPSTDSVKSSGISKPQVRAIKLPQEFTKRLNRIAPSKVGLKIGLKKEVSIEKSKENKQPKGIK